MRNNQIQILKRLREEYQQQKQVHEKMMQEENKFYKNSKSMEIQRHNEAITQMEQAQAERIQAVKEQEDEYMKQILQIRMRHAQEKKKIERNRQHELKIIEESRFPVGSERVEYEEPEMVPDAIYAEAVLTELFRLRNKNNDGFTEAKKNSLTQRIKMLSDAINSQSRAIHSLIDRGTL
ncbi:hypothetical protein M9Y10_023179 [Tritrichomonas musculus]|uniref:Uncharacterized protein n=1 Tax=Tritrichomonas musculus TaxID=1915356 RepID=A0ABR2KUF3_9EUKA